MRFYLLLMSLLAVQLTATSNYSTPGAGKIWNLDSLVLYSGGVVTFSQGVYNVNDTLTVSASDTIRVLTDFTARMASQVFIDILGVMIVDPPNSGTITAQDTSLKFLGLRFDDLSDGSILRKVTFEYGNGIRALDCNLIIDNCVIRFNTLNSTFSSGAISLFRSNSVISNCIIYRNRRAAITSGANIASSPKIISNVIYENNSDNANVPQINLGATGSDTLVIRNNIIRGLFDNCGGISLFPVGSIPIAVIEYNRISRNRYGIAIGGSNSNVIIRGNYIDSNNIQGQPNLGGSGINFNGASTQRCVVRNNFIRGNLWGITIQGTAKPDIGSMTPESPGLNHIYSNGNSGRIFDLFNNTPDSINAKNNWWGTSNPDSVEAHIFHRPDSLTLGVVNYTPFIITGVSAYAEAGYREYLPEAIAYPNPFNPATVIAVMLPLPGKLEVSIYDAEGRSVRYFSRPEAVTGRNEFLINAAGLSSGAYFYVVRFRGMSVSGKLLLLK